MTKEHAKNHKTPEQRAKEAEYMRAYRKANREKVLEQRRKNYEAKKAVYREKALAFYYEHREEIRDKRKGSHKKNMEANREQSRLWAQKNKEKIKAARDERIKKDQEAYKAQKRKYRADRPEQHKGYAHKRRARELGAEGSFTQEDILRLLHSQRGKCVYCETALFQKDVKKFEIDHIKALSKGGTNNPDNLQLLCKSCNARKSNKDPIEWAQSIGKLL